MCMCKIRRVGLLTDENYSIHQLKKVVYVVIQCLHVRHIGCHVCINAISSSELLLKGKTLCSRPSYGLPNMWKFFMYTVTNL
jgi:hypothetical protein